ncbi:MAG: pyridoxal phosphate-dependent aminotransferase, partial [Lachnospiraceae bacterium]|nr:pyridoxal phosphate-dependent aminotransferase [Lachnospiraceae bacterium]
FITIAPYFPEYKVFIEGAGASMKLIQPHADTLQIDAQVLADAIGPNTKGVVINSPNNPSGVIYTEETLTAVAKVLNAKSEEYGHPIFLISDEPYREICFEGFTVPWLPKFYDNTIVTYSFSKSLSLPGERIGYVLVPQTVTEYAKVYAAIAGAGRSLGYVNAPSLFQRVAAECCGMTSDISIYENNAKMLVTSLREMGYECVQPQGAFYLFLKALEEDDRAFSLKAREFDLLLVPGSGFGAPGHFRLAYCVQTEMIRRALPKFKALADSYK